LHAAAWYGHEAVVKMLVEAGAGMDTAANCGKTPLWIAAWFGHEAVAKLLVENGANPNARAEDGRTPLRVAKSAAVASVLGKKVSKLNRLLIR